MALDKVMRRRKMALSTFELWKNRVTHLMEAAHGLSPDDIPDCPYSDWYQSGMNTTTAVRKAISMHRNG